MRSSSYLKTPFKTKGGKDNATERAHLSKILYDWMHKLVLLMILKLLDASRDSDE